MIKIENLCKSFKDKEVLKNVNLTIEDGKIYGLIGINGAGKSTLLRLISGIYKADNGSITVDGEEVFDNERIKNEFFFLPDEPFYGANTTPKSLIELYKAFYYINEDVYKNYIDYFKLPYEKKMNNFSKGMKRQVFISLALAIKPKYLLLDEAFDGLDPLARLEFKRSIITLTEEKNTTIIISSHSLRELEDICDSYGLIDNKMIASSGDIATAIAKIHKYQVAFKEMFNIENLHLNYKKISQNGRVITIITEDEYDVFVEKLAIYEPIFIEEIKIDFEEMFMIQVESRGYLK